MCEADEFATAVVGAGGHWPHPPALWSYSSLREAEECPRRWMLSRATYPSIWGRKGYPSRPILPALIGEVAHRTIELIIRALHDRGCESMTGQCAVDALRELGGYTSLVRRAIADQVTRLHGNPRVEHQLPRLATALGAQVPDIRHRIQAIVARTSLSPAPSRTRLTGGATTRARISSGSHPEVDLRAERLRFSGRVDLLTVDEGVCRIIDFKTGAADAHHTDQMRTYALLWTHDRDLNPQGLPVASLTLSYTTHQVDVDPPQQGELIALEDELLKRVSGAEAALTMRPPPARPAAEMCRRCDVRHICEDYWAGPGANLVAAASGLRPEFLDCEAVVIGRNGARSWMIELEPDQSLALLRTATETPTFEAGTRLRLLDVAHMKDMDTDRRILTTTQWSEVYPLEA